MTLAVLEYSNRMKQPMNLTFGFKRMCQRQQLPEIESWDNDSRTRRYQDMGCIQFFEALTVTVIWYNNLSPLSSRFIYHPSYMVTLLPKISIFFLKPTSVVALCAFGCFIFFSHCWEVIWYILTPCCRNMEEVHVSGRIKSNPIKLHCVSYNPLGHTSVLLE